MISALYMVGIMQHNRQFPPFLPPFFAFIDLPSIVFLVVLVVLALRDVRTPAAHKRFTSATVLLGLPAALTRLYSLVLFPHLNPFIAFQGSLLTVEGILLALIVTDWRVGERQLAYRGATVDRADFIECRLARRDGMVRIASDVFLTPATKPQRASCVASGADCIMRELESANVPMRS